ncbi:hypothetical protein C4K40_2016 [Pseudomonas sp. CMR5c]|nr:hypothetical protein C4K40_2016 [Pseudomonas sp. CMR5c]
MGRRSLGPDHPANQRGLQAREQSRPVLQIHNTGLIPGMRATRRLSRPAQHTYGRFAP